MLQKRFGDHPSISSVEADILRTVKSGITNFNSSGRAPKGANQINMSKVD
jgi:hypothetical protein